MSFASRVKFEERYDSPSHMTTFYFVGDKSLLEECVNTIYDDAEGATLSLECPTDAMESGFSRVEISPHHYIDGALTDYDWSHVELSDSEIEELIALALSSSTKQSEACAEVTSHTHTAPFVQVTTPMESCKEATVMWQNNDTGEMITNAEFEDACTTCRCFCSEGNISIPCNGVRENCPQFVAQMI